MIKTLLSRLRVFVPLVLTLFSVSAAFAGTGDVQNVLSRRVESAQRSGTRFVENLLFAPATGLKHPAVLSEETLLMPLNGPIAALFAAKSPAILLPLKTEGGKTFRLQLLQANPTSADFNPGAITADGRGAADYTPGLHYQGAVEGETNSFAAVSVFANGDVMILFSTPEGNFVAGKLEDNSGNYVLYNDADMRSRPEMPCGVVDEKVTDENVQTGDKTTGALVCNKVRMYWEVSHSLFLFKGGLTNTQNYATGLFNQMQTLYTNDGMAIELKSLYIWTVADDIPAASSSAGLDKFKGYWNRAGNTFDGDVAHILTKTTNGNGGLAYVNVLCNRGNAYAYSDVTGNYSTVPSYSWDAMVVSHETGHNMGSQHTHWCGWNTGANNTCGSIDNCTAQQAGSNCNTCPATFLNSQPASVWKGTIMSYCHLVQRGISLANGFGPLPGAYIRSRIGSVTCLKSVINAELLATPVCNGPGAITLNFAANNRGTAPYEFLWNTGDTTQSLASIATPATYTVSIGDSNQCAAEFKVTVAAGTTAGNAGTPPVIMPICCRPTDLKIPLQSTPATFNPLCETVYWLRSNTALTTDADLRNHFDTSVLDRIPPANLSALSPSVGATLDVSVPASCAGPSTWYYTPVVARLPRGGDSIVASSSTSSPIAVGATVIGRSVTLPSQLALVTGCMPLDTPSSQTLIVTISGYTGRPNLLRLMVEDNAARVIYQQFGVAGNGTYAIPVSIFKDSLLRSLVIKAIDYNCSSPSTCIGAAMTITATRRVIYDPLPLRLASSCAIGNAVRLDFAPDNCTPLSAGALLLEAGKITLSPNPASQTATLGFRMTKAGSVDMRITNLAGQVVSAAVLNLPAGYREQSIDVRSWAKGMYFITLRSGTQPAQSLKLVVE